MIQGATEPVPVLELQQQQDVLQEEAAAERHDEFLQAITKPLAHVALATALCCGQRQRRTRSEAPFAVVAG